MECDDLQLAVRLPNWVGDVVMALPTVAQLQRSGFRLHLIGRGWAKELLAGLDVPIMAASKGIIAASRDIRALGGNRGVLFTNSLSTAASMRLAGIRAVGYRADSRRWLLHKAIEKLPGRHEVEYFWQLGECAQKCWGPPGSVWPANPPARIRLRLTNHHRVAAAKALADAQINGPYTVCCPMAIGAKQGQSKKWPFFPLLCQSLAAMGRTVVICPGPGEEQEGEKFLADAVVLPGLSLGAYAAILAGAEAVVANDSGPMHLAAAVGCRVLGIFGVGDPSRTRPWGGCSVGGSGGWPNLDTVLSAFDQITLSDRLLPPVVESFARLTRAA
jgi:heptosyltransferase II